MGGFLQTVPWLREGICNALTDAARGDITRGRWAVQGLCLAMTFTVMLPIVTVGLLIQFLPDLGRAFLQIVQDWAGFVGVFGDRPF